MSPNTRPPVTRHPDAEELAAFVDGRLTGAARDRMVAHLADCTECHEMMADVVTVLRDPALRDGAGDPEAAEEDEEIYSTASGRVLRPPASRFRRALPLVAAVAAAALVALVAWMVVGRWILDPASTTTMADLVAPLPVDAAVTARMRAVEEYGDVTRGTEGPVTVDTTRAFLLGVRNAELRLARASGNGTSADVLLARIEGLLLADGDTGSLVAGLYRSQPAEADRLLAEYLEGRAPWYALGRWTGVARVAAGAGHGGWFAQPAPRRTLRALRRHDWPPAVDGHLTSIAALTDGGAEPDELPALDSALTELLAAATGVPPRGDDGE